ncbi:unnamed protein product [Effrenium voratum]|nr:unnamed protein product [Effrenium voratum]
MEEHEACILASKEIRSTCSSSYLLAASMWVPRSTGWWSRRASCTTPWPTPCSPRGALRRLI